MAEVSLNIVSAIGISVVTASILAFLFKRLRLPSLLAYIVAGLLLSLFARPLFGETIHQMEVVSHLGLVFLLFIIGLEMDLRGVFKLGPRVAAAVLFQAPIAIGVILFVQWLAYSSSVVIPGLGVEPSTWFYYAVACALGSTAVVVKLLDDRFDLTSQATDPDGDGTDFEIDTIVLQAGVTYAATTEVFDDINGENITEEIEEEAEEHQFFYTPGGGIAGRVTVTSTDQDANGLPVGLEFDLDDSGDTPTTGTLRVILSHYDDTPKNGTDRSDETDVDVTFPVSIE